MMKQSPLKIYCLKHLICDLANVLMCTKYPFKEINWSDTVENLLPLFRVDVLETTDALKFWVMVA